MIDRGDLRAMGRPGEQAFAIDHELLPNPNRPAALRRNARLVTCLVARSIGAHRIALPRNAKRRPSPLRREAASPAAGAGLSEHGVWLL